MISALALLVALGCARAQPAPTPTANPELPVNAPAPPARLEVPTTYVPLESRGEEGGVQTWISSQEPGVQLFLRWGPTETVDAYVGGMGRGRWGARVLSDGPWAAGGPGGRAVLLRLAPRELVEASGLDPEGEHVPLEQEPLITALRSLPGCAAPVLVGWSLPERLRGAWEPALEAVLATARCAP